MKQHSAVLLFILLASCLLGKNFADTKDFKTSLRKTSVHNVTEQEDTVRTSKPSLSMTSPTTGPSIPQKEQIDKFGINRNSLSENAFKSIDRINVKDAELRDILRGLAYQYDLNIIVDNAIQRQITLSLSELTVIDCVEFLCDEYNLLLTQKGPVLRIDDDPQKGTGAPHVENCIIKLENNLLTVDIRNQDINEIVRKITSISGINIVLQNGVSGQVNAYFVKLAFESGLYILMENNGFTLKKKDNVYYVGCTDNTLPQSQGKAGMRRSVWVTVKDGLISLDLEDADINVVVQEIGRQTDISIITYGNPAGKITARCKNLSIDDALSYLFRGTDYTFKHEGSVYIVGDKKNSGLVTSKLIKLNHIRAEGILDLIPDTIKHSAMIEIVKEQNALMVLGTNDVIEDLENFLSEIDHPTPQILIEALVVDFNASDIRDLGLMVGNITSQSDSLPWKNTGTLDLGLNSQGQLTGQLNGTKTNFYLNDIGDWAGISNLGRLPANFYFKIQALENEGKANVRSRPQIATLNGHAASISIGTTQYYLLKTTTPVTSNNEVVTQESEHFEQVEANVTLSIVPWVSASGDVTVEIHPEFKTPVGTFDSSTPPTINTRVLDSTVRLKDGETIILGGLIQESKSNTFSKIPLLGDLPLIGRLFGTHNHNDSKTELMIYITPHVFYGDSTDNEKWDSLRKIDNTQEKK